MNRRQLLMGAAAAAALPDAPLPAAPQDLAGKILREFDRRIFGADPGQSSTAAIVFMRYSSRTCTWEIEK